MNDRELWRMPVEGQYLTAAYPHGDLFEKRRRLMTAWATPI